MSVLRPLAYGIFCVFDHVLWLLIFFLPGSLLIWLLQERPWRRLQLTLVGTRYRRWQARIRWLLAVRSFRAGWGSTCLSRSLAGRILLDFIASPNAFHLGMGKVGGGCKLPHAWLSDPVTGRLLTPGFTPGSGVPLVLF
jgi:hypothetical protein